MKDSSFNIVCDIHVNTIYLQFIVLIVYYTNSSFRGPFGSFKVLNVLVVYNFFRTPPKDPAVHWHNSSSKC